MFHLSSSYYLYICLQYSIMWFIYAVVIIFIYAFIAQSFVVMKTRLITLKTMNSSVSISPLKYAWEGPEWSLCSQFSFMSVVISPEVFALLASSILGKQAGSSSLSSAYYQLWCSRVKMHLHHRLYV